jgi:hypothetical protein
MKLEIDNFDGFGACDYTHALDAANLPQIVRRLNQASELRFGLIGDSPAFIVPPLGARVQFSKQTGLVLFSGYVAESPTFEYMGWGEAGPAHRYSLRAVSDEILLDRKRLPDRSPFVIRSAGNALRQLTEDILPVTFDTTEATDLDVLPWYSPTPQKKWSEHAGALALRSRASYRTLDTALIFAPVGANHYSLSEADDEFSPERLKLQTREALINDVTVIGRMEPSTHVKAYFVGDGLSTRFYLSQSPFTRSSRIILEEEYAGTALDPTRWLVTDPKHVISVTGGKLHVSGGNDQDGQTTVCFGDKVELGGAVVLQHGDTTFDSPSEGVLGGLYAGAIRQNGCLAGFRLQPSGTGSRIQGLVNGVATGPSINTVGGHRYAFTTRLFATEIYRSEQCFHSSKHPAGKQVGGAAIGACLRVVLEVHDVDPSDPGSYIEPSIVLYDGVISNAPGFVTYALVNATDLHCSLTFTRFLQAMDAEVRSALPGESYRTRLTGSLADGAECLITQDALQFFPEYVPGPNELIEVRYRGLARALARVIDPASVASKKLGDDDGVRGVVRDIESPPPRSSTDCEHAALALLDDATGVAWSGDYQTWSDFLPGKAQDIFPGDALDLNIPSRTATFRGIVREVRIDVKSLAEDHSVYDIHFADDAAESLGFVFKDGHVFDLSEVATSTVTQIGTQFLDELVSAEITDVSSTTVGIDSGVIPPEDGGIEVRRTDLGWGKDNDRNLVGRFATRTFTVPRLARVQDYYLRQYGGSSPVRYSRFSTALHLDYPL